MIYVSGPVTGLPMNNYPVFEMVRKALTEAGYEVFAPPDLKELVDVADPQWDDFMRVAINCLTLYDVEGVATVEGWSESKGARMEISIADGLGIPVLPWVEWYMKQESRFYYQGGVQ